MSFPHTKVFLLLPAVAVSVVVGVSLAVFPLSDADVFEVSVSVEVTDIELSLLKDDTLSLPPEEQLTTIAAPNKAAIIFLLIFINQNHLFS